MEKHDSRNWQVGDLALCINFEGWSHPELGDHNGGPEPGSVSTVLDVFQDKVTLWLYLAEWPPDPWDATSFVKVSPPALDAEVLREELYEDRTQ